MRNVLFVAYYYPPSVDAGAKRALGFVRHLPEHGYHPIVLTVQDGNYSRLPGVPEDEGSDIVRVVERRLWPPGTRIAATGGSLAARGAFLRRALRRVVHEVLYVPDGYHGFFRPAYRAAQRLVRERVINLAFTTSSPYTLLKLGYHLRRRTRIPWVADLRDLWVQTHAGYPYSAVRRMLDSWLERRWLSGADQVTTATEGLKSRLLSASSLTVPVACVYNGFLEPSPSSNAGNGDPGSLTVCFTGKLYEHPGHSAGPLFEALARLRATAPEAFRAVRCDFYGYVNADFAAQCSRLELGAQVRYHGLVSTEDAVRVQQAADVLFLPMADSPAWQDVVPTKTFEYMAARKPVLVVGSKAGETARLLAASGVGRIFSPGEAESIAPYLQALASRKAREGRLPPEGDPAFIEGFSYRVLAGHLARVFDAVLARTPRASQA